jgi:carbonic anhydrase
MSLVRIAVVAPMVLGVTFARVSAGGAEPTWSYRGNDGPAHWGQLSPAYTECASGRQQSPIDITSAEQANLPKIEFRYTQAPLRILNSGRTIQVDVPPGSSMSVDGHTYQLVQFHFHSPSEEEIHGKRHTLVAHLVHKDNAGKVAVVAVFLDAGEPNPALDEIFRQMPSRPGPERAVEGKPIDPAMLLPAKRGYYEYDGSLTTPPCTEGVRWFVLKQAVGASRQEIDAFRALYPHNVRPVQPRNGRIVRQTTE